MLGIFHWIGSDPCPLCNSHMFGATCLKMNACTFKRVATRKMNACTFLGQICCVVHRLSSSTCCGLPGTSHRPYRARAKGRPSVHFGVLSILFLTSWCPFWIATDWVTSRSFQPGPASSAGLDLACCARVWLLWLNVQSAEKSLV